ncbi:hypothetical protein DXG01_008967 [Tephrocybe rancida]|nr:hypothetical protein DXG01_008967 [Tephrocybe rancida]
MWTEKYKELLESMIAGDKDTPGTVKDYKEHHDNMNVHFVVSMAAKDLQKAEEQGLVEYFKLTNKLDTSNMMCFDFEGKIHKYESAEEILETFYPMRLAYYQKRKDHLANEIQNVFEKLTNQARFIQMIVDKQLVVSNRKKVDIIQDLRKHEFRPFPKISGAKKAGETVDAQEDEEDEDEDEEDNEGGASAKGKGKAGGDATDYDYLLGMAIWSLTKEKIAKLKMQAEEKEQELLALLAKAPKSLWNTDLDRFLVEWEASCKAWVEDSSKDASGKKVKRKQAVLQTRKSIGTGARNASDDDDDFRPVKAPVKRKPLGEASRPKPAAKKAAKDEDEDVVMEEPPAPKPKLAAPKRKAVEKKTIRVDSDDDDDDDIEVVTKPAPKKTIKPSAVKSDSDDEVAIVPLKLKGKAKEVPKLLMDSEDDDDVLKPSAAAKGKGKAAPKRKSPTLSEDSDDDAYTKPVVKKKKVTDFFEKPVPKVKAAAAPTARKISKSMKPASPPKPKPKPKAVVSDSEDDDDIDFDSLPVPKKAAPAPARAARATAAKKYIELSDDDDVDGGDEDASMFEDE